MGKYYKAGEPYRPSNGTEGMMFTENFCEQCIHEKFMHTQNHKDKKCQIFSNSLLYDKIEDGYPKEWQYGDNDNPLCTAFVKWDWGNDDEGNGFNEPPPPEPYNPNQLTMPFIVEEINSNITEPKPELINA